jgi:hypothetical protein
MAKKGSLFLLIQSLGKAEKRYFRLFAGNKEDAVYLRLFDAIDRQESYDEEKIRQKFKGEKFLRQLHVSKIYLAEMILKALKNYSAGSSAHSEILNLLADIEILFSRELYDQCHYRIEKAEKLAQRYEKLGLLYEVLAWKRKLLLTNYHQGVKGALLVTEMEKEITGSMAMQNVYWNYTLDIFKHLRGSEDLLHAPFFTGDKKAGTMQAKVLRLHVIYSLHYMRGNIKEAEKAATALIDYLEGLPHRISDDPTSYIAALSNKTGLLLREKRWKEVEALIRKIKQVPGQYKLASNKSTIRLWLRVYNIELEMYRDSGQAARGMALIGEISAFMQRHQKVVPSDYTLLLYYQFAYIYFLGKRHPEALKWINAIMNTNFNDIRPDIQAYARILNLVVHFELGNIIVLRYAVDACRRFLKKNKSLNAYEETILLLFSKLGRGMSREYKAVFKETFKSLFGSLNPQKESHLDYLDLKAWMQEKMKAGS